MKEMLVILLEYLSYNQYVDISQLYSDVPSLTPLY